MDNLKEKRKKIPAKPTAVQVNRWRNINALTEEFSGVVIAKKLGIQPATISNYARDRKPKNMGEEFAAKLELHFHVDRPEGWMSRSPSDHNVSEGPPLSEPVPLIDWVAALSWNDRTLEDVDYINNNYKEKITTHLPHGTRAYSLRVVGQSMWNPNGRPSYHDKDIIIVDPDQKDSAVNGSPVIARLNDESLPDDRRVLFKSLVTDGPHTYLASLNPNYPAIHEDFEVIGLVLGGSYS